MNLTLKKKSLSKDELVVIEMLFLNRDECVQKELRDWGLSFDSNLLSFKGRVVQAEKILQSGNVVSKFSGSVTSEASS